MQLMALTEGAFLKHLKLALLSTGKDLRVLANKQLSGYLVALWIAENQSAKDLLQRCLVKFIKCQDIISKNSLVVYLTIWNRGKLCQM